MGWEVKEEEERERGCKKRIGEGGEGGKKRTFGEGEEREVDRRGK